MPKREEAQHRALRRVQTLMLGRSHGKRRQRIDLIRKANRPILGFGLRPEGAIVVYLHGDASEADLLALGIGEIPKTALGFEVIVVREPSGAWDTIIIGTNVHPAAVAPGQKIQNVFSAEWGSLTCVLEVSGAPRVLSASHVVAPPDASPNPGDGVNVAGTPSGKLDAWSALAPFASVSSDVGVSNTSLAPTATWPDGTKFAGARNYSTTAGPFTIFGASSGKLSGTGSTVSGTKITLNVPEVGPVSYASQAFLEFKCQPGDSGAGVRDKSGYLVGMVVGATGDGRSCFTPWQTLGPAIQALIASA